MQIGDSRYSLYSFYPRSRQNTGGQDAGEMPPAVSTSAASGSTPVPKDLTSSSSFSNAMWLSFTAKDQPPESGLEPVASSSPDAALLEEFKTWADMSPAERIRAQYLEGHHISEDSLAAMSPEERKQIEDEIAREVKRQLGIDDGSGKAQTEPDASAISAAAAE